VATSAAVRPLPAPFLSTRDALHRLACFVVAPARKAQTGRIGLLPDGVGFGTPVLPDGRQVAVHGDRLRVEPGGDEPITTLRAAAGFVGVPVSPDPGVGDDLPPFEPDSALGVDAESSVALGEWYRFGLDVLSRTEGDVTEVQLWPEHFDLAVVMSFPGGRKANVGFSPGDADEPEPYVYVGPHDRSGLDDPFWNAAFGALLRHADLLAAADPAATAASFLERARRLLEG
jgi:hypothetical protein